MGTLLSDRRRRLAAACERIGATSFVCLFVGQLVLFFYYIWDRPLGAQPDVGRTVLLGWGRYGSPREAANLSTLMWSSFAAFGIIVTGLAIRVYKLGENVSRNARP